jgi:TolB-like protein/DNA-binding winged helix-turn-helix (wHTH) protein/tetratricopeptide (TPR) repeat protein
MRDGDPDVPEPPRWFCFETIEVDVAARLVLREGVRQPLEPKAFAVLLVLLQRHGEVVPRDELLDAVWGHRHVTPGVLTRVIAQLRVALGDDAQHPRMIETRHAFGYRFVAALRAPQAEAAPATPSVVRPLDDERAQADPHVWLPAEAQHDVAADAVVSAVQSGEATPDPVQQATRAGVAEVAEGASALASAVPLDQPVASDAALAAAIWNEVERRHTHAAGAAGSPVSIEPAAGPADLAPRSKRGWGGDRRHRRWRVLLPALAVLLVVAGSAAWWLRGRDAALPASGAAPSVAVLPFESLGGNEDDRYFTEGLSQEMHAALADVPGMKVAAWRSGPRAADGDIRQLGKRLGVDAVLEGSVQRDGKRLRVQARLSNAHSGYVMWSHSYDRDIGEIFDTQAELADSVVRALLGHLPGGTPNLKQRLAPTTDVGAYQDYLRGVGLLDQGRAGDDNRAASAFNAALSQDASFAAAQAYLCRIQLRRFQNTSDASAFTAAQQACARARELAPGMARVRVALGDLYRLHGQPQQAADEYRAALADPDQHVVATLGLAILDLQGGRRDAAARRIDEVLRLRPDDALIRAEIGFQYYLVGDLARATAMYADAVRLSPSEGGYWDTYGGLLLAAGDLGEARRALQRAAALAPTSITYTNLGEIAYRGGHYAEAVALQRQAIGLDARVPLLWANLGDALAAQSPDGAEARKAYAQCARMLEPYAAMRPDHPLELGLLAWCKVNLGEAVAARALVARALGSADPTGEAAFSSAATLAALGDLSAARHALQQARAAGAAESRIQTYVPFLSAGLIPPPARSGVPARPATGGTQ